MKISEFAAMKVLLLGSGGREHALAWKMSKSPHLGQLFIAPGNAGTAQHGTNVQLDPLQFDAVRDFVLQQAIELIVVGPEEPLVKGIVDYFRKEESVKHIPVIGPDASGARLEGSKDFSKAFMFRNGIPTARYQRFVPSTLDEGKAFLKTMKPPYVLKASGLCAGKGVVIPDTYEDACAELEAMLGGKFGAAGNIVVIEEFLPGEECSVFVLCDGESAFLLPEAKDHKRIGEGDTGLNTGGMGAFSPVPFCNETFMAKVQERIIEPTLTGLRREGIEYRGFIFIGLMNVNGDPFVIEYNCRMGDPETEVVMPRLENDLLELLVAVAERRLNEFEPRYSANHAATVMVVSEGYPGDYTKGYPIRGLEQLTGELVFHAGTRNDDNEVLTNGGRVIAFTALGKTLDEALSKSYSNISKICYEGIYFRRDIGKTQPNTL